jgi:hypothetical protein
MEVVGIPVGVKVSSFLVDLSNDGVVGVVELAGSGMTRTNAPGTVVAIIRARS